MKKKQAIQSVEKLKEKLFAPNKNDKVWKMEAMSLAREIFGVTSVEYRYAENIVFHVTKTPYDNNDMVLAKLKQNRETIGRAMDAWVETIQARGVYKKPQQNYLSRLSDTWITTLLLTIGTALFWGGYWFGERDFSFRDASTFPASAEIQTQPKANPEKQNDYKGDIKGDSHDFKTDSLQ